MLVGDHILPAVVVLKEGKIHAILPNPSPALDPACQVSSLSPGLHMPPAGGREDSPALQNKLFYLACHVQLDAKLELKLLVSQILIGAGV